MEQSCREPEKARQKLKLRAGNVEAQRGRGEEGSSFYYIRKKKTKRQRHTIKEKRRDDERRWVCVRLGFECVEEEEWNRLKRKRKGGATQNLMLRNPKNPKSESVWVSSSPHMSVWGEELTHTDLDFGFCEQTQRKHLQNLSDKIKSSHYYTSILILRHISWDE